MSDVKMAEKAQGAFRRYRVRSPRGAECAVINICKRGDDQAFRAPDAAQLKAAHASS